MLDRIFRRLSEASSYGGLGLIALGSGLVFKIDEAPQIAEVMSNAGEVVASGGTPYMGVASMIAGVVAILTPERGETDE